MNKFLSRFFGSLVVIVSLLSIAHCADVGQSVARTMQGINHPKSSLPAPTLREFCETDANGTRTCEEVYVMVTPLGSPNPYQDKHHEQCKSGEWRDTDIPGTCD